MVVAYADLLPGGTAVTSNQKQNLVVARGVVDIAGSPVRNVYTLSPGNNPHADQAFRLWDTNTLQALAGYLQDSQYRNFFFFGHGNAGWIGGDNTKPEIAIPKNDMAKLLNNYSYSMTWTNTHPYRFVFFQGCETGKGDYCTAFGIPEYALDRAYFVLGLKKQSRAFLGFKKKVDFNPAQWEFMANALGEFWDDWMNSTPLWLCLQRAQNPALPYRFDPSAVIYGATNLVIGSK